MDPPTLSFASSPADQPTQKEADRLSRLFEDAEFRRLFAEYAQDVSACSPEEREEREAYIRQLEAEGRAEEAYGRGAQLVWPEPAFVVKVVNGGKSSGGSSGSGGGKKVFINVCTSDKVQPPLLQPCEKDGRRTCIAHIPGCLARKPLSTVDRHGLPARAWVFVVHPEAVQRAASQPDFLGALIDAAKDEVVKASGEPLAQQHTVIRSKFKGGAGPGVVLLRADAASSAPPKDDDVAVASPRRHDDTSSTADTAPRCGGGGIASSSASSSVGTASSASSSSSSSSEWRFQLVHRERVDALADGFGGTVSNKGLAQNARRTEALILRVDLPPTVELDAAPRLDIDVTERAVTVQLLAPTPGTPGALAAAVHGGVPPLRVPLPCAVDAAAGRATFDRQRRRLVVTLPALAAAGDAEQQERRVPQLQQEQGPPSPQTQKQDQDQRQEASRQQQQQRQQRQRHEAIDVTSEAAPAAAKTRNELAWEQLHRSVEEQPTPTKQKLEQDSKNGKGEGESESECEGDGEDNGEQVGTEWLQEQEQQAVASVARQALLLVKPRILAAGVDELD